ncbi:MAG: SurA N-terminal domain-containing protein, partial [Desulfoplanes sp.]|nr:SurA N-terminal domain-containing protein [Desulfoplanes sp.]
HAARRIPRGGSVNSLYKRTVVVMLLGLFSCGFFLTDAWADEVVDRIVAVVNGEMITLFDVNQQLQGYTQQFAGRTLTPEQEKTLTVLRKKVLEQMVNDLLLRNEAQRLAMVVSDVEVQNQVEAFKKKHGLTEEQFLGQLKLQGMDRKDYETKIREDIMRQRLLGAMVRRKVVVTENEMQTYYDAHKDDFAQEKKVDLALILVDAGFDVTTLREKIMADKISFTDAAAMYSQGPGAKQGGDLGIVRWGDLGDAWKDALRGLGKGDVSAPFDLNGNQAILYLKDYVSGEPAVYADVKNAIRDILYRPRIEKRYKEYMDGLRSKAVVDIRL